MPATFSSFPPNFETLSPPERNAFLTRYKASIQEDTRFWKYSEQDQATILQSLDDLMVPGPGALRTAVEPIQRAWEAAKQVRTGWPEALGTLFKPPDAERKVGESPIPDILNRLGALGTLLDAPTGGALTAAGELAAAPFANRDLPNWEAVARGVGGAVAPMAVGKALRPLARVKHPPGEPPPSPAWMETPAPPPREPLPPTPKRIPPPFSETPQNPMLGRVPPAGDVVTQVVGPDMQARPHTPPGFTRQTVGPDLRTVEGKLRPVPQSLPPVDLEQFYREPGLSSKSTQVTDVGSGTTKIGTAAQRPKVPQIGSEQDIETRIGPALPPPTFGEKLKGKFPGQSERQQIAPSQWDPIIRSGNLTAKAYGEAGRQGDTYMNDWNTTKIEAFNRIKKGLSLRDRQRVGVLLDSEAAPEALGQLSPQVRDTYQWARALDDEIAVRSNLAPERRIANHLHHIIDPELLGKHIDQRLTAGATPAEMASLEELRHKIQFGLPYRWEQIPKELRQPFEMTRKGVPGYTLDIEKVIPAMIRQAGKKIFQEPTVKSFHVAVDEVAKTNPELAKYMYDHLQGLLQGNYGEGRLISKVEAFARRAMYFKYLTASPRFVLNNTASGQLALALNDLPGGYHGWRMFLTPQWRKVFADSGHMSDTFTRSIFGPQQFSNVAETVLNSAVRQVEVVNRGPSWLSGVWRNLHESGFSDDAIEAMGNAGLKRIPKAAQYAGDQAVSDYQGLFTKGSQPDYARMPGFRAATQFAVTPLKMIYGMVRRNPAKFAAFGIGSQLFEATLRGAWGVDLSSVLGIGVDPIAFIAAVTERPDDWVHAFARTILDPWRQGRSGIFSIGTGPLLDVRAQVGRVATEANKIAEGKPTASWLKLAAQTGALVLPVASTRAQRAVESYLGGGSGGETALEAGGFRQGTSAVRKEYLRLLQEGHEDSARKFLRRYEGTARSPLSVSDTVVEEARTAGRQLVQKQKQFQQEQSRAAGPFAPPPNAPPEVQRAFDREQVLRWLLE